MFSLNGRMALVTGASGGIGAGIAKALASQGARVAISGTRVDALEATAKDMTGSPVILPCNLADPVATAALVGQAEEALGGLDILVSNAGLTRDGLLMRMKDEDWQTVLDVNLGAYFRLSRAALRGMMKRRHGRIIGITSIVGVTGNPGQANYAASKAGLIGFCKALAREVASRNVTVNVVAPGLIGTDMTKAITDNAKSDWAAQIPMGRMGTPEEVAAAVRFLASDEASYITGQVLAVNGGMYM
jgi:3-oxoacyl-[acyl-carrier protein] reductase